MDTIKTLVTGLIAILVFISVIALIGLSMDFEKTQCIQSGGKWISGIIGGSYSYFCVPS